MDFEFSGPENKQIFLKVFLAVGLDSYEKIEKLCRCSFICAISPKHVQFRLNFFIILGFKPIATRSGSQQPFE
jgi:hypothetical protein